MVFLHCEFCCVEQDAETVQIVCYKHYIQTLSLQNDFVCVLLDYNYCYNIYHILCTYIYQYDYSCDISVRAGMKNFPHILYTNTALACHNAQ